MKYSRKLSKYFLPTLKEDPKEAEIPSHRLMLRAGMIRKIASGVYEFLPFGLRVVKKVENIIREEMDNIDGQEIFMSAMQPKNLWEKSGRWEIYGPELIRFKDRKNRDFCLGPTHEEVITQLVGENIKSYSALPILLYQFQVKFRDEIRPRFGVMRAREFYMKDAYSFDTTLENCKKSYSDNFQAYKKIFKRCGLDFVVVEAETGNIGGSYSHEFMVLADTGEDSIVTCDCGYGASAALAEAVNGDSCPKCTKPLNFKRGIETGHTFLLGTKYSNKMQAKFTAQDGVKKDIIMGCYGIGVTRVVAAAIEQNNDKDGIIWPRAIAPFEIIILQLADETKDYCFKLYEMLRKDYEVLWDDRNESPGVKFKDASLIGIPIQIIVGKKFIKDGKLEVYFRNSGNKKYVSPEGLKEILNEKN